MIYSTLGEYYQSLHRLREYKYSVTEVENMIPFERDLFSDLILNDQADSKNDLPNLGAPED